MPKLREQMTPLALAMLICDGVFADPWTGKKTVLGTFARITAGEFPVDLPQLCLFLVLTDARGAVSLTARIVDTDEQEPPLAESHADCDFPSPITVLELSMILTDIVFPAEGEYRVQLLCGTDLIMERRISVIGPDEVDS